MKSRDRVFQSLVHGSFDRLPIKHLAVYEIDSRLKQYFNFSERDELLERIGDDFREINPAYCGPDIGVSTEKAEHGVISCAVWGRALTFKNKGPGYPLARVESADELDAFLFPDTGWFDYSGIKRQCVKYSDYARIFGYCEMDLINGCIGLRGYEQTLIDIAMRDPVYLELSDRKLDFISRHLEKALKAGDGMIDFVHFGEDLGTQGGLLINPAAFEEIFAPRFRKVFDIVHSFGAKTMLHSCGSVSKLIPNLINIGLDVLDVVQTNAVDMDLEFLHKEYGKDIGFAGTMCVQKVLPFGTPSEVREEVKKRLEIFKDGGLIIGPSHQIQTDTPIENIIEMYRAAGGLQE